MFSPDFISALWMFLLPLVAILLPVWIGQRLGKWVKDRKIEVDESSLGSAVAASLGLFGFMLAFTFQSVSDRFSARKELLLREVSDIRSTYLYAGLIPEPFRSKTRNYLVEYVDIRVGVVQRTLDLEPARKRSQQILDSTWSFCEALAAQDRGSEAYSLFTSSANNVISLFNERITLTFQYHLHPMILYVLALIAFFSMIIVGYQFGLSGKLNIMINILLATCFAVVLWLIFAFDQPQAGLVRLNQAPLLTLQEQLHQMNK